MLKQPDLTLPFVSQFRIGQKVWFLAASSGFGEGTIETMTPNGFDEQGDRYPDSIGVGYGDSRYTINPSHHVFASPEEAQNHIDQARQRCDERNARIQAQYQ